MTEEPKKPSKTQREHTYAALVKEAQKRPGIREIMSVYEDWRRVDRGLDPYRMATHEPQLITASDHANPR